MIATVTVSDSPDTAAILIISHEFLLFSLSGPLPSALIFLFTQLYTISITLFIGVLNDSALLQVAFITNQGYTHSSICMMENQTVFIGFKVGL